jgi:hypothetical protein
MHEHEQDPLAVHRHQAPPQGYSFGEPELLGAVEHHPAPAVPPGPALPAGAVPLPDGAWAVLRDHRTMDGGDVADILSTIGGKTIGENAVRMRMAILGKLVTNWSFEHLPTPPSEQALRMLPGTALLELFALIKPAYELINGTSVRPTLNAGSLGDPMSPTPGSSE